MRLNMAMKSSINSLILLTCSSLLVGCADDANAALTAATKSEIELEVREFLTIYGESLASRDEAAIRQVYVDDERMAWFEDGSLKYQSVEDVLTSLKSIPAGMKIETEYTDLQVEVLGTNIATASAKFDTKVTAEGSPAFGWAGAMTMLLEKGPNGWRLLSGHSSTPSPRGR